MAEAERPVLEFSYENIVSRLRQYRADPLQTVVGVMRHWEVPFFGEFTVYWPAESYVVASDVSAEIAGVISRLLTDPQIRVDPAIADGEVSVRVPIDRRMSQEPANIKSARALRPYKVDRFLNLHLYSEETALDDTLASQAPPNVRRLWVG